MKKFGYYLLVFLLSIGIFYSAAISVEPALNPASNLVAARATPSQSVPTGEKIPVKSYQKKVYRESSPDVVCNLNAVEEAKEKPKTKMSERKKRLCAFIIALRWGIAANNTCLPEPLVSGVRRP